MPRELPKERERWRPPRGRHGLPPEVVSRSQRERLLEATMRVVAEKGYAAATVADLTKRAGISRTTFYELFFADKEACFLAAYDNAVDGLVRRISVAYEAEDRWPTAPAPAWRRCSRRWRRTRGRRDWPWSTSLRQARRPSAASAPRWGG